jgi:PAS domain S-box-containing protein
MIAPSKRSDEDTTMASADAKATLEGPKQSDQQLQTIIDTIPTQVWSTRPDGSAEFLNQRWLDYTGLSADQARDWGWTVALHPDDRDRLIEYWQSILVAGTPGEIEARMRRFDGAYGWFLFRANPLRDESGEIVKWYGTNVDIENRKSREEALRASELSWRQIADSIPGLVATTGPMGDVEFLNRQTLEYFGKTNEELKDWALIGAVHPDDLPRVVEARKKSIEFGHIYQIEHRCRRADGVYRWFQVRGVPVRNEEGTITAWYLLLTDIDDRKRAEETLRSSEQHLRLIVDSIPGLVSTRTPTGEAEFVNQQTVDFFGDAIREQKRWEHLLHPDDRDYVLRAWRQSLATGDLLDLEFRALRADGVYRWLHSRVQPLRDANGAIIRWYNLLTDIDDRKLASQRYDRLTPRERQVLTFVIAGFPNKQTAEDLGTSEITIGVHRGRIMRKMATPSLADLVRMAETLRIAPAWRPRK